MASSEVPGARRTEVLLQGAVWSQVISRVSREVVETVVRGDSEYKIHRIRKIMEILALPAK